MKIPAFQFYPADWRKDTGVQSLNYHDRGVWHEILCLMHESEQRGKLILNGIAMSDECLSRILGLDNQILTTTLTTLLTLGVASRDPSTGALINRRMVRDEEIRKIRQNAGKLGGNPILLKQIPTTGVKQIPTPSSSSSSSFSTSVRERSYTFKKPSLEEVKLCCAKTGLPESDAIWFWNKCEGNGWTNNGKPIKRWPNVIASWKAAGWMASQRNNNPSHSRPVVLRDSNYDSSQEAE